MPGRATSLAAQAPDARTNSANGDSLPRHGISEKARCCGGPSRPLPDGSSTRYREQIRAYGFAHLDALTLTAALDGVARNHADAFFRSWDHLVLDAYPTPASGSRYRRYSRVRVEGGRLKPLPPVPFLQSAAVNRLHGDTARWFAPVADETMRSPALAAIVGLLAELRPGSCARVSLVCGIHQIRVVASPGVAGQPTPEGVHRDGHLFVGQVFIGSSGISGGQSAVYDDKRAQLYSARLQRPLEAIMLDDRRLLHAVSAVRSTTVGVGHRDMLLVDFLDAKAGRALLCQTK
jgi:hypothetical protein